MSDDDMNAAANDDGNELVESMMALFTERAEELDARVAECDRRLKEGKNLTVLFHMLRQVSLIPDTVSEGGKNGYNSDYRSDYRLSFFR